MIRTAVDLPEYVVTGHVVFRNDLVPTTPDNRIVKIPYGPVRPGETVNTPYGSVITPNIGGDIVVLLRTAVDRPEVLYTKSAVDVPAYVVVGNVILKDKQGNLVGEKIPYGPVAPWTDIETAYGKVTVPEYGGDIILIVTGVSVSQKASVSDTLTEQIQTMNEDESDVGFDSTQVNSTGDVKHSENQKQQLPRTSASRYNVVVAVSEGITLLGLLIFAKRRKNEK
jgi:hypothetical protein